MDKNNKNCFMAFGVFGVFLFSFFLCGCNFEEKAQQKDSLDVQIVSWNVQTFFDAQTSGLEYSDFKGSKTKWNESLYRIRLERLCKSVSQLDADIFVFQEIENEAVMYDIANCLHGFVSGKKKYGYMTFVSEKGSAIGCAVLSRLPLGKTTSHQLDVRKHGVQPDLRPLMEVEVLNNTGDLGSPLFRLFVCHWKSKSGGEENAFLWQTEQEAVLAQRIASLENDDTTNKTPIVACGDFNRDLNEFMPSHTCQCCVLIGNVPMRNTWLMAGDCASQGSYHYKGSWEKIDHFFLSDDIQLLHFSPVKEGEWVRPNEDGEFVPYRFSIWNGEGYSDHLPVRCVINLK